MHMDSTLGGLPDEPKASLLDTVMALLACPEGQGQGQRQRQG